MSKRNAKSGSLTLPVLGSRKRFVLGRLRGTYEKRVFIGGSYNPRYLWRLDEIAVVVKECKFVPIEARDFGIPRGAERHYCRELLTKCRLAIFEISVKNGWQMELDWSVALNKPALCLWQYTKTGKTPRISSMVKSTLWYKANNKGYKNLDELGDAVYEFLYSI